MKKINDESKEIKHGTIKLSNIEFILVVVIGILIGVGTTLLCIKPNHQFNGYKKVDSTIQSIIDSYNHIKTNYYNDFWWTPFLIEPFLCLSQSVPRLFYMRFCAS